MKEDECRTSLGSSRSNQSSTLSDLMRVSILHAKRDGFLDKCVYPKIEQNPREKEEKVVHISCTLALEKLVGSLSRVSGLHLKP